MRTLAECLASDNFSILEKWTLEHAAKPYPTSQEKQKLAGRAKSSRRARDAYMRVCAPLRYLLCRRWIKVLQ